VSSFLRDLLVSIGVRKPERSPIGLRPHRDVVLPLAIDAAYERVREGFERTLGANIYLDDRAARTLEAGFGTINQERVRASFESEAIARTRVRIEAYFPAGFTPPKRSPAVDALADALEAGVGH